MNRPVVTISILAWSGLIAAGLYVQARYEVTPGRSPSSAALPDYLPSDIRPASPARASTLVLFIHPQCPCSRASLTTLARIVTRCSSRVRTRVLMVRPADMDERLVHSDLWAQASAIPGVQVSEDDGREAKRFGALTSGQTYLYDPAGRLLFQGGLTDSRGMEGDNAGANAILDAVTHGHTSLHNTKVYGCALFSPNSQP